MPAESLTLTPQQQAAINTRGVSIALSAGAGCGKTFVLTRRFLSQLQPASGSSRPSGKDVSRTPAFSEKPGFSKHDPLAGLVAITFTERAAREMRDRIRRACHDELQRADGDDLAHWLKLLRGLDAARISTIHSFCASLLRAHAVDAGIDPQFGMLEETLGETLLRRSVAATLQRLLADRDEDCIALVLEYGLEGTAGVVRELVTGRFDADLAGLDELAAASLAERWKTAWRERIVPLILADVAGSEAAVRVLRLLEANVPDHAEMQRRRRTLLAELPRLPQAADPRAALESIHNAAQVQGGGGKKAWPSEDVYEDVKNALKALREDVKKRSSELALDETDLHAGSSLSLAALRVVRRALADYEAEKRAAGLLDFDDLLLKTRDLLRDNREVRRRAAAGIDFLMIDEFQDTDPVQADIARLLCGDALLTGKLFLVGDAKQSIYRFRRADPRVFASLRNEIPEAGRLPLSVNFRSQPEILNFVNCVFAPTMGDDYEPLVPHVGQLSPEPAVEFLFAAPPADADAGGETAEDRRRREADWIARRIVGLLHDETPRIRDIDPETGETTLRPVRPGDVAVLFRTLSNAALYEDALRSYGIDYYLVGGRAFYAQQEIYDLVNLCRTLDDPDDEIALAGVLRSPLFSLTDDSLLALAQAGGTLRGGLAESVDSCQLSVVSDDQGSETRTPRARRALTTVNCQPSTENGQLSTVSSSLTSPDQQRQISYAAEVLAELAACKDRLPLGALLQRAIDLTGYDAALLCEHLGRRKLANLHKLIEMAWEFDGHRRAPAEGSSGGPAAYTMSDFVRRLQESVAEQTDEELAATHPETSNVVRLMTVHQSKGLEFPVVFVADMDWSYRGGRSSARMHSELGPLISLPTKFGRSRTHLGRRIHEIAERRDDEAETARLLYVACTRAADYLILSAGLDAKRKLNSAWLRLLAGRFDLETGEPAESSRHAPRAVSDDCEVELPPADGTRCVPATLGRDADIPQIKVHREPPPAGPARPARRDSLPLEQFRDALEAAEPEPPPETYGELPPDLSHRREFTVSEIRRADGGASSRSELRVQSPEPDVSTAGASGSGLWTLDSGLESDEDYETPAAAALGTLIHSALERIDFADPRDVPSLIDMCIAHLPEEFDETTRNTAIERVQAFIDTPVFAELAASPRCFRELEFRLAWPPGSEVRSQRSGGGKQKAGSGRHRQLTTDNCQLTAVVGTIDCLYQRVQGDWKLIDYKTGRVPEGGAEAVLADYEIQLAVYALAARELTGSLPESTGLVLLQEEVTFVPLAVTPAELDELIERVDSAIEALRERPFGV